MYFYAYILRGMLRLTLQVVQQPALCKVAAISIAKDDGAGKWQPTKTVYNRKAASLA